MQESRSWRGLNRLLDLEIDELGSAGGPVGSWTIQGEGSCDEVDAEDSVFQRNLKIEAHSGGSFSVKREFLLIKASAEVSLGFT